jgi:hypothetical protein
MAAVSAPSQIRTLRPEVHTGELDCLKPGGRQQFWYTVLGLGLAVGAFFAAWRLHGAHPRKSAVTVSSLCAG